MSWKKATVAKPTTPPKGFMTLAQIAAEMETTPEQARNQVNGLVREGRAEKINHQYVTSDGYNTKVMLYRLVK